MLTTTRPVALVTGASSGIGKEAAVALVTAGFDVVGTSRDTSRVTPLDAVTFLDLDVASDTSAAATVQQVIERFGQIDVLVNNAGIGSIGAAEESSIAQAQAKPLVRAGIHPRAGLTRGWAMMAVALVVTALFGFGVTSWYDHKGLHRIPAEKNPDETTDLRSGTYSART